MVRQVGMIYGELGEEKNMIKKSSLINFTKGTRKKNIQCFISYVDASLYP